MITLSSRHGAVIRPTYENPLIIKASTNSELPPVLRKNTLYLIKSSNEDVPDDFMAYACFDDDIANDLSVNNIFCLPQDMSHLSDGDILKLNPTTGDARVIYRKNAQHNYLLVTERCNSYCLMCSQPPRDIDDAYLAEELLEAIPLMDRDSKEIGITGGEPTLLGKMFFKLINTIKIYLPETPLHILSNGRTFSDPRMAEELASIQHPDLMIGIPLYSDDSSTHDFVVQAQGAFDETIKGIVNLKSCGVRIEIRVVVHKQTYKRLPQLAEFICRNLTFVDQVVFMGLEMTGFTKSNIEALWIDPLEYQEELSQAVLQLDRFRIGTLIYNHQLCLLNPDIHKFSVKSISDWKNEYMSECNDCNRLHECGGFFSSAKLRYSDNIKAFT